MKHLLSSLFYFTLYLLIMGFFSTDWSVWFVLLDCVLIFTNIACSYMSILKYLGLGKYYEI